jgi:DNA recombination protein RmuC
LDESERQRAVNEETKRLKTEENKRLQDELAQNLVLSNLRAVEVAKLKTLNDNLTEKLENQQSEIENQQKRLTAEFENIANKIMKQRSDEFSASNQKNIGDLLNPLKEKIQLFEKKVDETYDKELRDKISLKEEVRKLTELNARVSEEANNLTKALKGDVKKQGNWGEIILERVLERSGLTKGQEYEREEVVEGADRSVQRPDVILHLPDNKHIIIDSKVSLVAYERYITAENEEKQILSAKEHINSIRSHVKLLSEKNYQNAQNINTPDFVLMFIPIEASFSVAVQGDSELFSYAWERKIVIVSPTTLLATLRTISSIWKQENQTKNAQEIARLSGTLYDKFIGFTEDMVKIKNNLDRTSNAYDDAVKKMKDGSGNIIRTAEKIKELGAKTGNKSLPAGFDNF